MEKGDKIVQYPGEYSVCTGCKSCEILCGLMHEGVAGPERGRIKFVPGPIKTMMHQVYVCEQCEDHPCYEACPKKDEAMCIDENGIVYVNRAHCIGCGLCAKACGFEPKRVRVVQKDGKKYAIKCDLCRDIEGGPVCVRNCPAMALGLKSESVEDLSRPLTEEEKGGEDA